MSSPETVPSSLDSVTYAHYLIVECAAACADDGVLLRWEGVSTSIPNVRQKQLTALACRSSSCRLVNARHVGLQNCVALDRVPHAHHDWCKLRGRRARVQRWTLPHVEPRGERVSLQLTGGSHRNDALPAAPPFSTIPLPGELLDRPRRVCQSPSCRPLTSRAIQRGCVRWTRAATDAERCGSERCTDGTTERCARYAIQRDYHPPPFCTHLLCMRDATSAAIELSAHVDLEARRYLASVLLPDRG